MSIDTMVGTCPRCRSMVELVSTANRYLDGKYTFLCPVCCEGEIEYETKPPKGIRSSERQAVLVRGV